MSCVLITGGAGYLGSHTACALLCAGETVLLIDDFSGADGSAYAALEALTGLRPVTCRADVADRAALRRIFSAHKIDAVMHFAGRKSPSVSLVQPLDYYRTNLDATLTLLEVMAEFNCKTLVFSSSAAVYGAGESPYREESPTGNCASPYGWSKYMLERILCDAAFANAELSVVALRYFNPVGAHPSALLGEMPRGESGNLMPRLLAAAGDGAPLCIFGADYPTPDGTGVRDYIHVMDLAQGHLTALDYARAHIGFSVFNLGCGHGVGVLELVHTFEEVNGVSVPYTIAPRRAGDLASVWADTAKAEAVLGWRAERSLADMCRDAWRFYLRRTGREGEA